MAATTVIIGGGMSVGQAAAVGLGAHGDMMPGNSPNWRMIVGTGAADGDAEPFLSASKGSMYFRLDASDDATHVFQKYDEGDDDNDWASLSTFSGVLAETLTVGQDDTGYDVKFFGATAGSYWLWDESADGVVQIGTLTIGVDDAGHDVKLFGATAGSYWLWDESADGVVQIGTLTVGVDDAGHDVKLFGATAGQSWLWDESADKMIVTAASQFTGAVTVGVDDTGHDVKLFGATAGSFLLWDESDDQLELTDSTPLAFGDAEDIVMQWTGSIFTITQLTADSGIELGVDGAGIDFKLFGDTASAYAEWDQSADELIFGTGAGIDITADAVMIDFKAGAASSIDPSATAETGWINIAVDGTTRYVPFYAAS